MTFLDDLQYSLFGGSSVVVNLGPNVKGEMVSVRVAPVNIFSVAIIAVALILFIIYMYFYLAPLFRNRGKQKSKVETSHFHDALSSGDNVPEKNGRLNFQSWLLRRSRDQSHSNEPNRPSIFSRATTIPPVSSPPPAYSTSPPATPPCNFDLPSIQASSFSFAPFVRSSSHGTITPHVTPSPVLFPLVMSPVLEMPPRSMVYDSPRSGISFDQMRPFRQGSAIGDWVKSTAEAQHRAGLRY